MPATSSAISVRTRKVVLVNVFGMDRDQKYRIAGHAERSGFSVDNISNWLQLRPLRGTAYTLSELEAPGFASMRSAVLNIAHRGASGDSPENTIVAFRDAVQAGAQMCELDVQMTRDHHLVVIHDETVDRTTDGRGAVDQMTLAELKRL